MKTQEAPLLKGLRASLFNLRQNLRQKTYKLSKLNDANEDLSKRWFVYYSIINPSSGKFKREREYLPTKYKTFKDRYAVADQMIEVIDLMLIEGTLTYETKYSPTTSRKVLKIIDAIQLSLDALENKLEKKSFLGYRSVCNRFIKWIETTNHKYLEVTEFRKREAATYLDYIAKTNIGNVTQNKIRNYLSAVFSELIEKDLLEINPWHGFKSKKETQTKIDIWHQSDLQKFMAYVKANDIDFYLASLFLFHGYVRPIELTRLKKKNIDLQNNIAWIDVRKGKEIRMLPCSLSKPMVDLLTERILGIGPNDYIFSRSLRPGESKTDPRRMKERFDKIKKKLNFDRVEAVFYELKHTGVSIAAAKEIPMINIRNQCRHTSIVTTEKYLRRLKNANDSYFYNFPDQKEVKQMFS